MSNDFLFPNADIDEKQDVKLKLPSKFQVILHNDNYTSMDFVVKVIMVVFHKSLEEANQKMEEIHKKGKSLVGIYTREIAESKVIRVQAMAKENNFPLKATMEEVS